ncbi:hypothetical protein EXW50_11530 [Bacillus mycoides]|uniref:hypothetical protein n=1 Tax=Bacillus mycoides TaxID=1405 RepID=UPI001C022D9A|nr:hypothetical protein [Bacillus mycoides]QWG56017.1 hypothetical protein EXW26_11590 [Bacillus mycoides]QWG71173.1 hypothetical protein EXW63_02885 [Bacillus mycoides]QWH23014.1 hypothetical protein EXW50_11530 [Bacillus mycoides]
MAKTINRDAGDKTKGFRLQRLRAISLLFDQMEKNDDRISVFASTEYLDDVYIKKVSPDGMITYTEGDKNYDNSKKFSFMSREVTNSLIIFLDNWLNCDMSDTLYYCFYTNIQYTYEKDNTPTIKKLGIELPEKPILDHLIAYEFNKEVIECIKKRLLYEYEEQYKNKEENGYLGVIKEFGYAKWVSFFSRISWQFGQYDEKELEVALIDKLEKRSFLTNIDVLGNEDLIINLLENKFGANEKFNDAMSKHVTSAHVENILLRIAKDIVKKDSDPVYSVWENLEPPTDNRGLKDKIFDVDKDYKKRKIGLKARDIASIKEEFQQLSDQEQGSYRYRIFEACQKRLNELLDKELPVDVDGWLEELFEVSKKHLEDKSKDYSYVIQSDDAIQKVILELIDSCFLSFDEKGFYDGNI